MTLTCYKFELLRNFARFRGFRSQQQLNEWRQTCIVSDGIVAHLNVLFSDVYVTLISQCVPPLEDVKQRWVRENELYFRATGFLFYSGVPFGVDPR